MIPATLIWADGRREDVRIERAAEGPTSETTIRRDGRETSFRRTGMQSARFVYEEVGTVRRCRCERRESAHFQSPGSFTNDSEHFEGCEVMPTGYTCVITDKPETTFPQFAMRCARAFGALIEMRDDATDAPIPFAFEPPAYVKESLDAAYAAHAEAETLTLAEAELRAVAEYDAAQRSRQEYLESNARETALYTAMLAKVDAWTPPTAEHEDLKKFMREQITISITEPYDYEPKKLTGAEWLVAHRTRTAENLSRRAEDWKKAQESAAKRTAWVRDLRGSL